MYRKGHTQQCLQQDARDPLPVCGRLALQTDQEGRLRLGLLSGQFLSVGGKEDAYSGL